MNKKQLTYIYIIFATLGRLIPHPANFTPEINLCLFAGKQLSRKTAILISLCALLISDICLAYLYHYPIIGYWTLFSYSGFAAIVLIGSKINDKNNKYNLLLYVIGSTLGYWIWTNFGAWILTPYYPNSAAGITACYAAALPFLRNALLGDLVWMVIIFGSFEWVKRLNQAYIKDNIEG